MASSLSSLPFQLGCLLIILGAFNPAIAVIDSGNGLPPGYIYHPEIGAAYKIHNLALSWDNARIACNSEGSRLATIDTSQKLGFVTNLRQWGTYLWTGINRNGFFTSWTDVDGGTVAAHLPWGTLGNIPLKGACVAVSGLTNGLANMPCFLPFIYICEKPVESNHQGNQENQVLDVYIQRG